MARSGHNWACAVSESGLWPDPDRMPGGRSTEKTHPGPIPLFWPVNLRVQPPFGAPGAFTKAGRSLFLAQPWPDRHDLFRSQSVRTGGVRHRG